MTSSFHKIVYLTAGAGGMYCGSCLQDNALAATLTRMGLDIQLVPLYTPIRTDEESVSLDRVFFGGINVYLQQKSGLFRHLPSLLDRVLSHPRLIRWATARHIQTTASQLGDLTVSMLSGSAGRQRKEVRRLCHWLAQDARPHLVNFSNILIAGCVPYLKSILDVPVLVTVQGEDVFLEELPPLHRQQALEQIGRFGSSIDGFLVHSRFYAQHMSQYLGLPAEKFHVVRPGITTVDFPVPQDSIRGADRPNDANLRPPTVGYLARLAPEKGLDMLCQAFIRLRQRPEMDGAVLRVAGWLGQQHQAYAEAAFRRVADAGLAHAFQYEGEVDRPGKLAFLQSIDVLSVPANRQECKGRYVLEALAAGVPVVQPQHGSFPELLEATGGGLLVVPDDPEHLAGALYQLLTDHETRRRLGRQGQLAVHRQYSAEAMGQSFIEVYRRFLDPGACSTRPSDSCW